VNRSFGRRLGAMTIAATAAAAFGAPTADAAGLSACGPSISDKSGDGYRFTAPFATATASQAPHYDITETFFTVADGSLRAHIKVLDMKAEPDDVWWPTWAVRFTAGGTVYRANARMIDGAMTFYYWKGDATQGTEIAGEVIEGPGGGVVIDVPTSDIDGFASGMTLTDVYANTIDGQVAGATPYGNSDRAPDSGTGTAAAAVCSAPAQDPPATQSSGSGDPAPTASEQPAQAPSPAAPPSPAPPLSAAPARTTASSKAAKKKKATCQKAKSKKAKRKAAACKKARKKSARKGR
jgi:hypothetical protein